jgi:hypothetical protein
MIKKEKKNNNSDLLLNNSNLDYDSKQFIIEEELKNNSSKSKKLLTAIFNIGIITLFSIFILHLIINLIKYNNYLYVTGDFVICLILGITIAIIKTRNLVAQYKIFSLIIGASIIFHLINTTMFLLQKTSFKEVKNIDTQAVVEKIVDKIF